VFSLIDLTGIHKKCISKYAGERLDAVSALETVFSHIPDKAQAWLDLHNLTQDKYRGVRLRAAGALGTVFSQIPDKAQAWQDLIRLTQDEDRNVRLRAAGVLGTVFSQIPDKAQAWQDLIRLTQDEDSEVRMYACYSLGRVSIFKAAVAYDTDKLKKELKIAIAYFEKSFQELRYSASLYSQLYLSYSTITFQKAEEGEVQKYIAEARRAVGSSESKALLLEAVKNLAEALEEMLKQSQPSYCDKSEDLAPGATRCIRKAFQPLIDSDNLILQVVGVTVFVFIILLIIGAGILGLDDQHFVSFLGNIFGLWFALGFIIIIIKMLYDQFKFDLTPLNKSIGEEVRFCTPKWKTYDADDVADWSSGSEGKGFYKNIVTPTYIGTISGNLVDITEDEIVIKRRDGQIQHIKDNDIIWYTFHETKAFDPDNKKGGLARLSFTGVKMILIWGIGVLILLFIFIFSTFIFF